jgi:catechol 2,3-dioxygenase-like lactoylglutathione lyase family enzyme
MFPLSFHHVKLDVSDLQVSLDFYQGILGLRQIVRYDRADGVSIVQLSPTGRPPGLELWFEARLTAFETDRLHVAFGTDNVRTAVRELRQRGVVIDKEPFRIDNEVIAFIRDPDGYLIELNQQSSPISSD